MKTLRLLLFTLLLFASTLIYAQDCQCHFTISPTSGLKVYDVTDFPGIKGGDVICIEGGQYGTLRFTNLMGSEEAPITIINCGGQVILNGAEVNYGVLQFNRCQYIHLTGTGDDQTEYGIFIEQSKLNENDKSGLSGVVVGDLSSDFEIDHIEIQRVGFAGIIAKTDPKTGDCESAESQATFRANFTLKNLHIHNNYIHNTGGEGMYIGSTWGYSTTSSKDVCNGFACLLENIEINNNRIEQAGWDAIQLSLAHKNASIHHNEIIGYGHYAAIEEENNQSFGIALGGGTRALVYNNKVIQLSENTTSIQRGISGLSILAGSKFYNNLIVNAGYTGIWVHIRTVENEVVTDLEEELGYHFFNNTIVNPGLNNTVGMGIYVSTCQPASEGDVGCRYNFDLRFMNNIIVDPAFSLDEAPSWMNLEDIYIQLVTKEIRDSENTHRTNNLYVRTSPTQEQLDEGTTALDDLQFKDAINNDYQLMFGSTAIDAGIDLNTFGINSDLIGLNKVYNNAYDIGAYEYDPETSSDDNSLGDVNNNSLLSVYPNPVVDVIRYKLDISEASQYTIEIYNMDGRLVYKENKSGVNSGEIHLNEIGDKMLVMQVKTSNMCITKKILVK